MKLRGNFVVRQVMDQVVAIPVGCTALQMNGMVVLNDVSKVIWESLADGADMETIVLALTEHFVVTEEEARADVLEFIEKMRNAQLLEEEL